MLGSSSVVPWFAVAMLVGAVLAVLQLRRFLPAVGRSQAVLPSTNGDVLASAKCGFQIRKPGRLGVSYPLAKMEVTDRKIVLRGPIGDYVFGRDNVEVTRLRRTAMFQRIQISNGDLIAIVYLRDVSDLRGTWLTKTAEGD